MPCGDCTRTYDLGCVQCGDVFITLPVNAPSTGTYEAFFKYRGQEIRFTFEGTEGEPLVVGVSGLNENFRFSFYVLDPNGDRVSFGSYDCFAVTFTPCAIDGDEPEPDEECDPVTLVDEDAEVMATLEPGEAYEVVDQNGDPVAVTLVAGRLVITMPMEYIKAVYADATEALADEVTVPDEKQAIRVGKRLYQGDGVMTSKELVEAKTYNPYFVDGPTGFLTEHDGVAVLITPIEPGL